MRFRRCWLVIPFAQLLGPGDAAGQHEPVDKGTLLIGGSAAISGLHRDGTETTRFSVGISPMVGVFAAHGLAIWGAVSFAHTSEGTSSNTSWGVGPGAAFYFAKVFGRAYPFLGLQSFFSWSSSRVTLISGSTDYQQHLLQLRPSLGLLFMLIPHVGLEGELYVVRSWTGEDPDTFQAIAQPNTTGYGFTVGVAAFVF